MKKFLELLFSSQIQSHVYHLQTKSFAQHLALQEYYEGIVPLIDTLAENYQGKYGIVEFGFTTNIKGLSGDEDTTSYFAKLLDFVQKERENLPQDGMLVNVYDDIEALVSSTHYKLKHLS